MAADMVGASRPPQNVVLVGAGHAHVEVLRSFAESPPPDVSLTLITRSRYTPYSGMLPGLIAGNYRLEETRIDTRPLAVAAGARFLQSEAVGLDLESRSVMCRDAAAVPYDIVSLDIGSTPTIGGIPGAADHAIPVKPIDGFLDRFEALRHRVMRRSAGSHIVVVGGGAAGVELALSMQRRLSVEMAAAGLQSGVQFTLVSASAAILTTFPARFQRKFERVLGERGIAIVTDARVTEVRPGHIQIEGHPGLSADEVVWATEAAAPEWLGATALELDPRGFIAIDPTLRAVGNHNVFAVGDVAAFLPRKLPKSGVYAVRQGPVLAQNIRRLVVGEELRHYSPQQDALYIVSTGERHAIATRNGLVVEGDWVWTFKNWLDRRWMRRYQRYSAPEPSVPVL